HYGSPIPSCPESQADGCMTGTGTVLGTYLHGLFENRSLRDALVNWLIERRGLPPIRWEGPEASRDAEYDRLAECLRHHLDLPAVYTIMGLGR
ncbi:MAG TPA: cobyric acid synthase CobQ, partial [Chloroflexota bacterium]|nr:cobyric acid synthase CobQ [Chloroflexota bacterium]